MKTSTVFWIIAAGWLILASTGPAAFAPRPNGEQQSPGIRTEPAQVPDDEDDDEAAYRKALAQRLIQENCLICHDENMITGQRLTSDQWKAEIEKMVNWGSPLPAESRQPLIDYLAGRYSDREPAQPLARTTLQDAETLERPTVNPGGSAPDGDVRQGERLYATNCANCHGLQAMGGDLGPNLVGRPILAHPQAYHKVVREGLRRMPSFQRALSPVQETDLLAWIRNLSYPHGDLPGGR